MILASTPRYAAMARIRSTAMSTSSALPADRATPGDLAGRRSCARRAFDGDDVESRMHGSGVRAQNAARGSPLTAPAVEAAAGELACCASPVGDVPFGAAGNGQGSNQSSVASIVSENRSAS